MITASAFPARAVRLPDTPATARPLAVAQPAQRLLLYANASGAGSHLRHDVSFAARFLEAVPHRQMVLLTGQAPVDGLPLPRGLSVVHLPTAGDGTAGVCHTLPEGLVRRARAAIIADVARRFAPDVVLVDSGPEGQVDGELEPAIAELRKHSPTLTIIVGLGEPLASAAPARVDEIAESAARPLSVVAGVRSRVRRWKAPQAVPA
jgi:predicted glycosyltransferase